MSPREITAAITEFFCLSRFQRARSWSCQNVVGDYVSHYASRALAGHAKIESENDL